MTVFLGRIKEMKTVRKKQPGFKSATGCRKKEGPAVGAQHFKNVFAAREFSPLYKGLFPPISGGKIVHLHTEEFYPLYQVTHSTFTYI